MISKKWNRVLGNSPAIKTATEKKAPTAKLRSSSLFAEVAGNAREFKSIATILQIIDLHAQPAPTQSGMLDRADFEPVFFAPFVSSVMTVEPAWIDFNGHLNMAYYNVLFDRGLDELYTLAGLGQRYLQERQHSFFTAEVHVRYLRELQEGAPVRVTFQLLDFDAKRMHFFQQLFHATEGWVSATSENLSLHVDMAAKRTAPFPPDVAKRLGDLRKSHARLPRPEAVGRRIAMPVKA